METKASRSVDEIRQEYSGLCAKAGHIQYQVKSLSDDLNLVNQTLRELNLEALAAKPAEAAAPVAAAEAQKEEAQ